MRVPLARRGRSLSPMRTRLSARHVPIARRGHAFASMRARMSAKRVPIPRMGGPFPLTRVPLPPTRASLRPDGYTHPAHARLRLVEGHTDVREGCTPRVDADSHPRDGVSRAREARARRGRWMCASMTSVHGCRRCAWSSRTMGTSLPMRDHRMPKTDARIAQEGHARPRHRCSHQEDGAGDASRRHGRRGGRRRRTRGFAATDEAFPKASSEGPGMAPASGVSAVWMAPKG